MATSRQQIIDLINDYIYTNGRQRITAVQLNEILTLIANSFELVGQGTGGGINDVLNTDPNVEDNQKIINRNGGQFELSGMIDVTDNLSIPYIGFYTTKEGEEIDPRDPDRGFQLGAVISNQMATLIGNSVGFNPFDFLNGGSETPFNNFLNSQKKQNKTKQKAEQKTEQKAEAEQSRVAGVLSLYLPDNIYFNDKDGIERGLYSGLIQDNSQNIIQIQGDRIRIESVGKQSDISTGAEVELEGSIEVGRRHIEQEIYFEGSDMNARETLYSSQKEFAFNWNRTLLIDADGLRFDRTKRLSYDTDSNTGTAGVATLNFGEVIVNTTAIRDNSYVMLTVQNTGQFNGNIRVSEIVSGSGFTVSSSDNTDTCNVLWQIIDIY